MRQLSLIVLAASGLFITACGQKPAEPAAASAPATKAALDGNDPCRLLSAAEAEAVLAAPLAVAPYRSYGGIGDRAGLPLEGSDVCWYEAGNRRNLSVTLTRSNGGSVMKGVGQVTDTVEKNTKAKFQDGTELAGEWDEAKVMNGTSFMALRGDSLVEIDTGGSEATPAQIGSLADAAIKRLEAPLPYDSSLSFKAAEAFYAKRPASGDPCSLLSKADVEAVLGGAVQGEPQANSSGDECIYTYATTRNGLQKAGDQGKIPKGTLSDEEMKMMSEFMGALGGSAAIGDAAPGATATDTLVLNVEWRNGYRLYRVSNQMMGSMGAGLGAEMGAAERKALGSSSALTGPWDHAQLSKVQFSSVRSDVQINLRPATLKPEQYAALMTRAYEKALK
ncbi:MAG: hypothetical protein V4709_12730 [Pseudomonadota bacterium]